MANRVDALLRQLDLPAKLPIVFSPEVRQAIASAPGGVAAAPVVALESTIISHGMPYPQNVECARSVEAVVRRAGAVPATIAILGGVIHVGLSDDNLERLAKAGRRCAKCSRRDLPLLLARRADGATTVSATILVARLAGLSVMATGGIGGVHRGGETTMDVSADLTELAQTRVLVVCAGVKSILDINRTLEVLETQGVAVMAYGTDEFPAFFTRSSGVRAPARIDTADQGAEYVTALRRLRYSSGGVLGVPLPKQSEADGAEVEAAIRKSLEEAKYRNIAGRDVTPYILQRICELTQGRSLKANIALVMHNARIASEIAIKAAKMAASEHA